MNMQINVKEMQEKLFIALSGDNNYTIEDFNNEFSEDNMIKSYENFKYSVKFVNKSNNPDPEYATSGSSGFDLRANEEAVINPNEFKAVATGLYFDIPENMEIQVRSRSGLAAKNGVCVLNSPGTVDSDYTGEVKVILINHGKEPFIINYGDRIAQAVIANVTAKNLVVLNKVTEINKETERNSGGFGSTGIK
jgi:dUTP pyrophosphatase